jgi:DNA-binding MarR family transcriptional regulator
MKNFKHKNEPAAHRIEIANRLHSSAIHLLRRVRKQDAASGEGPARLSALSVLVFGGPMTLGQLADAEQVTPPTMSRILVGLEQNGLAKRIVDPNDARRIRITPSAKGVQLLHRARQRRIDDIVRQLEPLGGQKLETLRKAVKILEKMLRHWK